ncbi:hypothetical protein [Epilithonimonas caeni]|uniref:hypothetical protein n=1 Tax=Epilithonimonas caeni TaxID=365343 RepID=UPI000415E6E1|nr:hypothetical protein [Epilithonimonas caeni]
MEENKFYRNADLFLESESDFKKNVKNVFTTEDFSRQLDLAMYLSKSKFKQLFFNQHNKNITVNTFDKAFLMSSAFDSDLSNMGIYAPLSDMQANPKMFPSINLKFMHIGETITFQKMKYLSMLERRGLDVKNQHAYKYTYAFYHNDKDSFYAGEFGIGVNNSLFDVNLLEESKKEIINTSLLPTQFCIYPGYVQNFNQKEYWNSQEVVNDIKRVLISYNIMMSLYYEWSIYIKEKDGMGFILPIDSDKIKECFDSSIFRFEERKRVIHFVKDHYRKKPRTNSEDLSVYVQRYLRGENKVIYKDFKTEIIPPRYDLNRIKTKKNITDIFKD